MAIDNKGTSPERLLDIAIQYCESMELLANQKKSCTVAAIGLLASHSLELAFKAYLLNNGWLEKELKDKVKHDLEKAWIEAYNSGLSIDQNPPYWLRILAIGHGNPYLFRYPQNGTAVAIPAIEELVPEVKNIIHIIESTE